jgi:hypothetical protein
MRVSSKFFANLRVFLSKLAYVEWRLAQHDLAPTNEAEWAVATSLGASIDIARSPSARARSLAFMSVTR